MPLKIREIYEQVKKITKYSESPKLLGTGSNLTLSAHKRNLIFSSFLYCTSITTLTPHTVTPPLFQHHKVARRLVTTNLDALLHAPYPRNLKQHSGVPAVSKFHVVEEHSLGTETFCVWRSKCWTRGDFFVWKEHIICCCSVGCRWKGWQLDSWGSCWSVL